MTTYKKYTAKQRKAYGIKMARKRSSYKSYHENENDNFRTGGFMGIELKFYDQKLVNGALVTNTDGSGIEHDPSATVLLNTVVQGDGESNRDGRRITMKSIYVDGVISCASQANQTATDNAACIFIALIMDTQTNGATLNSEEVYINPGANAALSANLLRNLQFSKRFRILKTVRMELNNPTISYDGTNVEQSGIALRWSMFVKLNTIVNYSNTTETVANIVDNSLHIIATTSSATLVPLISYNSRLRYYG